MLQKSLIKAMQIIDVLSGSQKDYGISEIAQKLGLNKSNIHDILSTFESMGYVHKDEQTRRYQLDFKFLQIAHNITGRLSYQEEARRVVTSIANEVGEICYFGIPYGDQIMYLEGGFPGECITSTKSVLGMTAPLYCTGIGKAVLAFMPEERREQICSQPLTRFTDTTLVNKEELIRELDLIAARGFSIDNMEHEYGVKCVAVPVLNASGQIQGGVSITGPSLRFPQERIEELAHLLKESVGTISRLM